MEKYKTRSAVASMVESIERLELELDVFVEASHDFPAVDGEMRWQAEQARQGVMGTMETLRKMRYRVEQLQERGIL